MKMNKATLIHRGGTNFSYVVGEDSIRLLVKTGIGEVTKITVLYGDLYIGKHHPVTNEWVWDMKEKAMSYNGTGELFDYWIVTLQLPLHRFKYAFLITGSDGEEVAMGERQFGTREDVERGHVGGYIYPFAHKNEIHQVPEWVKDTRWYQIFPDRFYNGDETNDVEPKGLWGALPVNNHTFYGGDLKGITAKLDYIKDLGFNGIYMTPIFEAPTGHKYDTKDYFKIDPSFGTNEDFKELVKQAHQRGIKIMLDAVFNHSGYQFGPWQDVLKNQEKSRYKDWFFIRHFPVKREKINHFSEDISYEMFAFAADMPKWNTENPEVIDYLLKVATFWIEYADIDGWRLDVAPEIDHLFWRKFREAVRSVKKDLYIVGELNFDSINFLLGDQFDSVMNYTLTFLIWDYTWKQQLSAEHLMKRLIDEANWYPEPARKAMFNLVDSHDTTRIYTFAKENRLMTESAFLLQYFIAGTPSFYYGDEIAMKGEHDPDNRRCMIWDEKQWDMTMLSFIKQLNRVKANYADLFSEGDLVAHHSHPDVFSMTRTWKGQTIALLINLSTVDHPLAAPLQGQQGINLMTGASLTLPQTLAAKSYVLISL